MCDRNRCDWNRFRELDELTKVAVKRNPDAFEASHAILLAVMIGCYPCRL